MKMKKSNSISRHKKNLIQNTLFLITFTLKAELDISIMYNMQGTQTPFV
jgi:hypothetical protein